MDSCGPISISCPVATEAEARRYCAPIVYEPVPEGCEPNPPRTPARVSRPVTHQPRVGATQTRKQ
jgi:hypothetical protein